MLRLPQHRALLCCRCWSGGDRDDVEHCGRPDAHAVATSAHHREDSRMRRRDLLALGMAALSLELLSHPARAQAKYPDRPIRLVIPFPPGGGYDAVGRPWAEKMKSVAWHRGRGEPRRRRQ